MWASDREKMPILTKHICCKEHFIKITQRCEKTCVSCCFIGIFVLLLFSPFHSLSSRDTIWHICMYAILVKSNKTRTVSEMRHFNFVQAEFVIHFSRVDSFWLGYPVRPILLCWNVWPKFFSGHFYDFQQCVTVLNSPCVYWSASH